MSRQLPEFINEIILTTFGVKPKSITVMSGGLSGASVYQLEFADKSVILKLVNQQLIGSDNSSHFDNNVIPANAGIHHKQ